MSSDLLNLLHKYGETINKAQAWTYAECVLDKGNTHNIHNNTHNKDLTKKNKVLDYAGLGS